MAAGAAAAAALPHTTLSSSAPSVLDREGQGDAVGGSGAPNDGGTAFGRTFSPLLLAERLSASRSMPPAVRLPLMSEYTGTASAVAGTGGDGESAGGGVVTPGGGQGRRRMWGHGSWTGSPTPRSAGTVSSAVAIAESDGESFLQQKC